MGTPDVDVIIAVHSATRPIRRAVASVLAGGTASVRAIVVAHNIDEEIIRRNLADLADDERVVLLHLADGIPSPAGPMNHGLDHATADYFSLLGSDDELAPGAIDRWLAIARKQHASTVLARIDRELSGPDPMPPTRRRRTADLDPVKDRLAYRCAPLGLVSRERFGDLRFTPGLHSGEDLEFTARLWFTGEHIAYARAVAGYVVHEDGTDRVTSAARPVAEDFAFLRAIEDSSWFARLGRRARRALGVKNLRLHVFDAILLRLRSPEGLAPHRDALIAVIAQIERMSPGAIALLSRADRAVFDALRAESPDPERIEQLLGSRWAGGVDALLTRNPLRSLQAQAPLRTLRAMTP
ncbi:glycosyltransferase family 2 protein [Microbacterium xylanilyticum]